jgi:hypothetical protein
MNFKYATKGQEAQASFLPLNFAAMGRSGILARA